MRHVRQSRFTAPPVDEMLHSRRDVTVGNGIESAVRVAGGIPTLGGGLRVSRRFVGRRGAAV